VCATIASGTATQAEAASPMAGTSVTVEAQRPLVEAQRPLVESAPRVEADRAAEEPEAAKKVTLRRIRGHEMTPALVIKANEIIREHHKKDFGTNIFFEIEGKRYVGRIEEHYHPPGGELRPWGKHPGCSLFVVESAG